MNEIEADKIEIVVPGIGKMQVRHIKRKILDMLSDLNSRARREDFENIDVLLKRGTLQVYLDTLVKVHKELGGNRR